MHSNPDNNMHRIDFGTYSDCKSQTIFEIPAADALHPFPDADKHSFNPFKHCEICNSCAQRGLGHDIICIEAPPSAHSNSKSDQLLWIAYSDVQQTWFCLRGSVDYSPLGYHYGDQQLSNNIYSLAKELWPLILYAFHVTLSAEEEQQAQPPAWDILLERKQANAYFQQQREEAELELAKQHGSPKLSDHDWDH